MDNNSIELKRLFNVECEANVQSFHQTKSMLDLDDREARIWAQAYTIAKLLDGCSVLDAKTTLKKAKIAIQESQIIRIGDVQSVISSWGD